MSEAPNYIIMPFIDCWDYTKAAATDALVQTIEPCLLLIDNGSKRSVRLQTEQFGRLAPIGRGRNFLLWRHAPPFPSIAATWNRALDFVWEAGGERALVVNNDVRLHEKTYELLLYCAEDTEALFVTAVGVNEEEFTMEDSYDYDMSRGGPDFSCYLISKECHAKYRFDENFIPAYHEDNDYHRRMILGGDGDRIFSINVPFLHYGSVTINRDEKTKAAWGEKFERNKAYYVKKWGGVVGKETFDTPFGKAMDSTTRAAIAAGDPDEHEPPV